MHQLRMHRTSKPVSAVGGREAAYGKSSRLARTMGWHTCSGCTSTGVCSRLPITCTGPAQVVFAGLDMVVPLMTGELLQFPKLARAFFGLLCYMIEVYPERVAALPGAAGIGASCTAELAAGARLWLHAVEEAFPGLGLTWLQGPASCLRPLHAWKGSWPAESTERARSCGYLHAGMGWMASGQHACRLPARRHPDARPAVCAGVRPRSGRGRSGAGLAGGAGGAGALPPGRHRGRRSRNCGRHRWRGGLLPMWRLLC